MSIRINNRCRQSIEYMIQNIMYLYTCIYIYIYTHIIVRCGAIFRGKKRPTIGERKTTKGVTIGLRDDIFI